MTTAVAEKPYISWLKDEIVDGRVELAMEEKGCDGYYQIVVQNLLQKSNASRMEDADISEQTIREKIQERIYQDSNFFEWEWECLTEDLSALMNEINQSEYWYTSVENFGWRRQNGHQVFEASNGTELLQKVLPKCECSFKIYKRDNTIVINNAHHDSPTWAEWYYIRPATEEEIENM